MDAPGEVYREIGRVAEVTGAEFIGGSGRNLICSGGGAGLPNGFFRPEIADAWRNGGFYLEVTGASAATISDGTDVVAVLTTGGTAQQLMASNSSRKGFSVQNVSTGDLWIRETGTAAAGQPSLKLTAGTYFETPAGYGSTGAVSIYGATTGQAFTAREW